MSKDIPIFFFKVIQKILFRKQISTQEPPQYPPQTVERKPYSPFQVKLTPDNTMDYALARVDDLINWARKVGV